MCQGENGDKKRSERGDGWLLRLQRAGRTPAVQENENGVANGGPSSATFLSSTCPPLPFSLVGRLHEDDQLHMS